MPKKIPILLYHDLESEEYPTEKESLATKGTVVHLDNFEQHVKYLAEKNYKTISLDDYFNNSLNEEESTFDKIIITFDDGHYSNYYLAYPVLLKYGFKATFFITTNRIGGKYHLSEGQIKEMANNGMEFAAHGLTHKDLPLLNIDEIKYELEESRRALSLLINRSVQYMAFPGGHYNKNVLGLLGPSGYFGACSCLQGLNSLRTNRFLLRRIEIRSNVSGDEFRDIFDPVNQAFYQTVDSLKMLVRKSLGLRTYANLRKRLYRFYIFKR